MYIVAILVTFSLKYNLTGFSFFCMLVVLATALTGGNNGKDHFSYIKHLAEKSRKNIQFNSWKFLPVG